MLCPLLLCQKWVLLSSTTGHRDNSHNGMTIFIGGFPEVALRSQRMPYFSPVLNRISLDELN